MPAVVAGFALTLTGCGAGETGDDGGRAAPSVSTPESPSGGVPAEPPPAQNGTADAKAPPVSAPPSSAAPEPEPPEPDPETAAVLAASEPVEVAIGALDVREEIIPLGLTDEGVMEVPQGPDPVGWYDRSPTPGERGPAVLAGHVTWNGTAGVFRHLDDLAERDEIVVTRADGSTARFAVTGVEQYGKDEFPTARVYGNTPGPELRLITCAGDYDPEANDYSDNVVVYARSVAP
ncbi:sortase family protein [Haloactinopolyspora alba]|uniref:Sortase family protein n=1 Tax=Haloactinopolyspora alba TaxID=648780 RepID=A0A2P8DZ41_9ACTN|nr:class F sortase [Haloactinopolyspora alba]PSL02469.1 sortase family protein [Haloactinopolyspora alba]